MNELAEARQQFSLTPTNFEEAMKFCTTLAKSALVPKDFIDHPANILVAVQWGMELGLQPMQAMQSIAVINGRPSLWGDAVIGLVRASGLCEYIRETVDENGASCRTKRKGDPHEEVRTFTVEDAKKAGLWGKSGPWSSYPKRMLQMRARSWCLRDVYPDVLRGVHVAEESQDLPEKDAGSSTIAAEIPMPASTDSAPPAAEVPKPDAQGAPAKAADAKPSGATADFTTKASDGQVKHIRKKQEAAGVSDADIFKAIGIESLEGISVGTGNMILKFLDDPAGYMPKAAA